MILKLLIHFFQAVVHKLRKEPSSFAKRLTKNISIRILQRRGVASRLSRYARSDEEQTKLDAWLREVQEEAVATRKEALCKTFLDFGDIEAELRKFRELEGDKDREPSPEAERNDDESSADDYETLRHVDERRKKKKLLTPSKMMKLHRKGYNQLPAS